ncbi:MAG TPA: hypothetical protein PK280_06080 [Planctomycetota bacterium]|nr:hypothetical protein [Planctomycetota bacterium]
MNPTNDFSPAVMRVVDIKAIKVTQMKGFSPEDYEDIRQELLLELVRKFPSFDPARSQEVTFAERVLSNHVTHLLQHRHSKQQTFERGMVPYPEDAREDTGGSRGHDRPKIDEGKHADEVILRLSVAEVLKRLPPDLRNVAELLKEHSKIETAHRLGISNHILNGKIEQLRRIFRAAGLEE